MVLLIFWCLVLFVFNGTTTGYIETVFTSGCGSCRLMLTCRHLTSIIAILEVNYNEYDETEEIQENCTNSTTQLNEQLTTELSLRESINHRCSGVNHCSFILTEDCPGAENLTHGNLTVKYACITEDRVKKYCNSKIFLSNETDTTHISSQGFIHNPGYPRFYSGLLECNWRITVPFQQHIELTILDLSILVDNVQQPNDCTDVLEIKEDEQVVYSTCRMENNPVKLLPTSENIEIVLKSRRKFTPRRGILIHYNIMGCRTPEPPEDGYLLYRNETVAEFRCCVGFAFPDTGRRTKILHCLNSVWDTTLPLFNCQKAVFQKKRKQIVSFHPTSAGIMSSDLVAPALLILVLFLINAGVLFFIYKAKKKQQAFIEEFKDEEMGTFTANK